jgi:hypothetical protein
MDWELIKGGAALWGALLSTWLLLVKFLETRPIIVLEVVDPYSGNKLYRLRISNVSRRPIHIAKVRILVPKRDGAIDRVTIDGWALRDVKGAAMTERLDVFLKEDQEAKINFVLNDDVPGHLLIGVFWYRHTSLVFPTMPRLIYRSKRRLLELREHPTRDLTKEDYKAMQERQRW